MYDSFLERLSFVMLAFVPFSLIIWVKGFLWLKYHLHYNVKVRQTTTEARVRDIFKWNFVRPYVIWAIIIPITCLIFEESLLVVHVIVMLYILIWKEALTLFGWNLGEWNTQIPHISFFRRNRIRIIEQF